MVSLAHCRHERLSQWSLQSLQSVVSWPDNTHNKSRQCKSHLQVTSVRGKIARSHKTWEWRDCLHLGRAPGSDWEWEVSTRVAARVYPAHLSAHTGTHWDIPALSGQHATSLSHTGGRGLNFTTITDNSLLRRRVLAKYWASRCFVPSAAQSLILQPSDYVICVNTVIFLTINWQYFPHWCFLWRWTVQWWEAGRQETYWAPVHLLHVSLCLCLTALSNPSSLTTFPHVPAFVLSLLI